MTCYNHDVFHKKMVLRKLTIDNSVKYIPKSEQTKKIDVKLNTMKKNSLPRKQDRIISRNNNKMIENVTAHGFKYLKGIMNCYV